MRVVTLVGARLQFIRETAVSLGLRAEQGIEEIIVHTGRKTPMIRRGFIIIS